MFLKKCRRLRCSLSVQESLADVSMSQMSICTLVKVDSVTNMKAPARIQSDLCRVLNRKRMWIVQHQARTSAANKLHRQMARFEGRVDMVTAIHQCSMICH